MRSSLFTLLSSVLLIGSVAVNAATAASSSAAGEVSFPNSGAAEAQQSFLYGLAQLHNFEYRSAARAFRAAQEKDSDFALAYWGEAMIYNHPLWLEVDPEAAREVLERLGPTPEARLAKAPTQRERDWLQAVEILYGEGTKHQRDLAYSQAMERLHRKYPEDPEAAAFYALSILGTAHSGRDFATYMRAAAVVEEVYRTRPRHPGVLHYLIHSYDDPIHAPLGLRAARTYAEVAPAAAHAQHMTSHIFVAMGMWDDVVKANQNASAVVNREREESGRPPRYCGHYNFWLLYGYTQQGRPDTAQELLAACRETALGEESRPVLDPDNNDLHSYLQMRARYVIDTRQWDGEVAHQKLDLAAEYVPERVTWHFTQGFAAAQRGDNEGLRAALGRLQEAARDLEPFVEKSTNDFGPLVLARSAVLDLELQALVARAAGYQEKALSLLQRAVEKEEALPLLFGPPFVDKPSLELYGELLLEAERAEEAVEVFSRSLARTPERTATLEGLAEAAELAGDEAKAADLRARLGRIWHRAESKPVDFLVP
jgi:tetratricopeptide (TPR) repeat protein